MCIRDRSKQTDDADLAKQSSAKALEQFKKAKELGLNDQTNDALIAVSYTHLTLPTSDLV